MRTRLLVAILAALALLGFGVSTAGAARPALVPNLPVVQVDTSRAGHLPAAKAIGKWNAGLTTFQLQAVQSCSGTHCLHIVEVLNGPTFLCTNPLACTYGGHPVADGSCTVESTVVGRDYAWLGQPRDVTMSVLLHEMGHGITGIWDGTLGFDCIGLSHDSRATSVMNVPLGAWGPVPTVPDAQNYAEASAAYRP